VKNFLIQQEFSFTAQSLKNHGTQNQNQMTSKRAASLSCTVIIAVFTILSSCKKDEKNNDTVKHDQPNPEEQC